MNKTNGLVVFIALLISCVLSASHANAANARDSTQAVSLTNFYDNKDSHYSIYYPADWIYEAKEKGMVIFSGKEGTAAYYATVNIQTILTKRSGGDFSTLDEFVADIKKQTLQESPNASFIDKGSLTVPGPKGVKLKGQYLKFIYTYEGELFHQWQIVILREDANVFYTFAYTAPVDQYQADLGVAQTMLKTWSIYS